MKGNKKKNALYAVAILLCVPFIVFDVFEMFRFDVDMNAIIIFVMSLLSAAFSICFSYLLVLKQLYTNRYSKAILDEYVYSGSRRLIVGYFLLLTVGFVLLLLSKYVIYTSIYYSLITMLYLIQCGCSIYKKIGENEVRKVSKKNVDAVLSSLNNNFDESYVKEQLKHIVESYDDAYNNFDQNTCVMIIKSFYEFCEQHIKNRNSAVIENKKEVVDSIKYFIGYFVNLMKEDTSDFAVTLNRKIIYSFCKLAEIAIDCDNISLLEKYMNVLGYVLESSNIYQSAFFEDVYEWFSRLIVVAAKSDKQDCFNTALDISKSIYMKVKLKYGSDNLACYLTCFVRSTLGCERKDDFENELFSNIKTLVLNEIDSTNCKTVFIVLSQLLIKDDFNSKVYFDEYLLTLKKIVDKSICSVDLYSYIVFVIDKLNELKEEEKASDLQYYLVSRSLQYSEDPPAYICPEFSSVIKKNVGNAEINKQVCSQVVDLVDIAIGKNNVKWLVILLNEVKDILKDMPKQHKDIQIMWFEIFTRTIRLSLSAKNNNHKEIAFKYYKDTLREMDDNSNVSKDLANRLVHILKEMCELRFREDLDFSCEIVEFLDDLLGRSDAIYRFVHQGDTSTTINRSLYEIAVDAIERNQELVIQRVSNVIGWRIKEAIEKGHTTIANTLIGYAIDIFNLAQENNISQQTIVFVGTLFIIIGAFCKTNLNYLRYQKIIIEAFKNKEVSLKYLAVSKLMRSAIADVWKTILGDNPKAMINGFWNDLTK